MVEIGGKKKIRLHNHILPFNTPPTGKGPHLPTGLTPAPHEDRPSIRIIQIGVKASEEDFHTACIMDKLADVIDHSH